MIYTRLFKQMFLLLLICLAGLTMQAKAQQQTYVGVWRSGNDGHALMRLNSWADFTSKWKELAADNLRLANIEVTRSGNGLQYTGVWRRGTDGYALYQIDSWQKFVSAWQDFAKKNLRLVDLEVFKAGNTINYVGVFREGRDGYALSQLHSWEAFVAKWKELAAKNLRLVDIEAIAVGKEIHYTGVWRAGKEGPLYLYKSFSDFAAKWKELGGENQRLVDLEVVRLGADLYYIGVFNSGTDGYALYQTDDWGAFTQKWKALGDDNLRLVGLSIFEGSGKPAQVDDEPQGKPLGLVFNDKAKKKDPVSGLEFPVDMPPIVYPEFIGCNAEDKKKIQEGWAYAHFSMWRAYQVVNYIANHKEKAALWNWGSVTGDADNWSPRTWFGSFDGSRTHFQLIHEAINKAWHDRFLGKKYNFKAKCREGGSGGEHPCYLKDDKGNYQYSANHILVGTINYCPLFLDRPLISERARVVIHEVFHWLSAKGLYISDTHSHWDKVEGKCKLKTEKIYGVNDALHLATSLGCWGDPKPHREKAALANDNYAFFIQRLGKAIWEGRLTTFPTADFYKDH
jgi:uncharacterized protein YjeT (DUF2065 family)